MSRHIYPLLLILAWSPIALAQAGMEASETLTLEAALANPIPPGLAPLNEDGT